MLTHVACSETHIEYRICRHACREYRTEDSYSSRHRESIEAIWCEFLLHYLSGTIGWSKCPSDGNWKHGTFGEREKLSTPLCQR